MRKKLTAILFLIFVPLFYFLLYPFLYSYFFLVQKNETLVIGLDGGDFNLLQHFFEKGKLPHIKKIVNEGSVIFFENKNYDDFYSAWNFLVNCNKKSIWEEMKERNIFFGTLYWPNVLEKGEFFIPYEFEGKEEYPRDIYDSKAFFLFANPFGEFFRKTYWLRILFPQNKQEKDLIYEFYLLDRKAREFFYVREKFKPNITFLFFSSPLRIEEYFFMYSFPKNFSDYLMKEEIEKYGSIIEKYYEELDRFIGELNKENKTILIVSARGIKEVFPPKIVDKIDINKILKELNLLEFDFRGEIDFSKTKAYTLEEGLDTELKIFIQPRDLQIKEKLKKSLENFVSLPSRRKIVIVEEDESGVILKRNIPFVIEDERFYLNNKTYEFKDFLIRRVISASPSAQGFIIVNKKLREENFDSHAFCKLLIGE